MALAACGDGADVSGARGVEDYLMPEGAYREYQRLGEAGGPVRMLRAVTGKHWYLRSGTDWEAEDNLDEFYVVVDEYGLWLDDDNLLPPTVLQGEEGLGVSVTDIGDWTTWYGTFPDAVSVERTHGRFQGTNAFAPGMGPITFTLDGVTWDLVYYE